jgi:hypothetical protein
MPTRYKERDAWEHELREELPAQLAEYQRELVATPNPPAERREWLTWQIRRVEKRMAEIEARLARSTEPTSGDVT